MAGGPPPTRRTYTSDPPASGGRSGEPSAAVGGSDAPRPTGGGGPAIHLLRHAEEAVSVLLGAVLFAVLIWQVVTRYVLDDPSVWTEEAARYLYVGVVFFGAAAAVRDRSHIGIPFVIERMPPGPALALSLATRALTVGFCAAIAFYGARAAAREWDLPSLALEIPMGLVLAAVPAAMALAGLRTIAGMAEDVRAWREGRAPTASAARDF